LLPSVLSSRLSGTLAEVEEVVATVEEAGSVAAAVDRVHPPEAENALGLAGAVRRIRRRFAAVRASLRAIVTLMPERFAGVRPTMAGFRAELSSDRVLVTLRELAERHLGGLPAPHGFRARARS
jgi:hypothetical protein